MVPFPTPLILSLLFVSTTLASPSASIGFSDATIAKVKANMNQIATHSWELGTAAEAMTELDSPSLSVFGDDTIPPPSHLSRTLSASISEVTTLATNIVRAKPANSSVLIDGDGAVGDPASLGVAVLLTSWTRTDRSDTSFAVAAEEQLNHLLFEAPRNTDGAISHREDQVQLWADFVYMAPPFIAYYGALSTGQNKTNLLQEAYDQCRLYRNNLRDPATGLWKHIVLGTGQDLSLWGTGNAWATAGMLRVLETIRHSDVSSHFRTQTADLTAWVDEIVTGAWKFQQPNGTLLNHINDPTSFADSSSTALIAASSFRLASLTGDLRHIPAATKALDVIKKSIDSDGFLLNTVDPLTFDTPSGPGVHSPEGQAFVLLLNSAFRDFLSFP